MTRKKARLLSWENREEDLRKVTRYHRFKVMLYRTNLALHSMRVQQIVSQLLPIARIHYPELDPQKTILISKFHDDHEMVSKRGDVPFQLKLSMNGSQALTLEEEELAAAEFLSDCYGNPKIHGYAYRDLLAHAIRKDCPEAQLHSFADKLDGYGEAMHEVLAGNVCFLDAVVNYIVKVFRDGAGYFPLIGDAFQKAAEEKNGPFFFPLFELGEYFQDAMLIGAPHTPESLRWKTGVPHYEMWKETTLALPDGLEFLTKQIEAHEPRRKGPRIAIRKEPSETTGPRPIEDVPGGDAPGDNEAPGRRSEAS